MARNQPPDHRGPDAVAGLRQRQQTRLSGAVVLMAAGSTTWPDFKVDERVRVLFSAQDPIDGVVTVAVDRNGWVKVKEEGGLGAEFLALAACCVRLGDDLDAAEGEGRR